MAEELGKGLQNPLHGCESRTRLHLGECWNGLQSGLKIRAPKGVVGSTPTSPTTSQLISTPLEICVIE